MHTAKTGWRWGFVVCAVLCVLGGCRTSQPRATDEPASLQEMETAPLAELETRPLYTFNEAELARYLGHLQTQEPNLHKRLLRLARQAKGQPYDIYLLGEFPFEVHDTEPLYCLSRSDCLTFCEHMYAMALSDDFWVFLRALQRIRYRDGEIGMVTRNHYTLADWNRNKRLPVRGPDRATRRRERQRATVTGLSAGAVLQAVRHRAGHPRRTDRGPLHPDGEPAERTR